MYINQGNNLRFHGSHLVFISLRVQNPDKHNTIVYWPVTQLHWFVVLKYLLKALWLSFTRQMTPFEKADVISETGDILMYSMEP